MARDLEKVLKDKALDKFRREFPTAFIWKISDRFYTGIPDMFFGYKGFVCFIEFKRVKEKLKPLQRYIMQLLERNNIPAYKCETMDEVDEIINYVKKEVNNG